MIGPRVIYSGRPDAFRQVCPEPEIYIAPKARLRRVAKHLDCPLVSTEDVTETNKWLWLNEAAREGTRIVYDQSSIYYKVNSEKARRLSRLAEVSGKVSLVDVTPFCEDVQFLYMTWRYVSREILGYAHHYAFAGGHAEVHDGRIVSALDFELLASKIAPHCILETFPVRERRSIARITYTDTEQAAYRVKREDLFGRKKTPQPILTGLADLVHDFASRKTAVLKLATKNAVAVCNLQSYADWYRSRGLRSCTYAKPCDVSAADRLIFAEPPIVYTYRRLQIEAGARCDCEVIDVRGDAKVDDFLGGRIDKETGDVRRFCEALKEAQRARLSD